MCGLFAFSSRGRPIEESALAAALGALHHRGPDGQGRWIAPDRRVALGHTRLSVIDLAGGGQPLHSEDDQVHLIVNGEFYDHGRTRAALRGRGHVFRTASDSEIALHLYEEHGPACVHHLRGEFAFVLWDERRQLLLAARDRFGVKPLCYAQLGDALLLASEAKALFAAGVPAAWDAEAFFHAASLQYLLPDRTLFAGVRQLRPGHLLLATAAGVRTECYWDLDYATDAAAQGGDEDAAREALAGALSEAVRLRLQADVQVACQLSGGLDSSAVLGLAAREAAPLPCFTVRFAAPGYDEAAVAAETAARIGAPLHVVDATPALLAAHLPAAIAHGEGLAINTHIAAKYLLSRAVRDAGYKVILTGEGADEVMLGYAHLRHDLLRHQAASGTGLLDLLRDNPATAGIHLPAGAGLPMGAVADALGPVPAFLLAKATLGQRMRAVLADDVLARFSGYDAGAAVLGGFDVPGQLAGRHPVHQAAYLWTKLALANYILRPLGDGMEMAHGVEGRLPFLDHVFFGVVRDLPIDLKIRAQPGDPPLLVEKYLLREAARPVLTDTVYRRAKHPFMAPPQDPSAAGDPVLALLYDALAGRAFAGLPFFDTARARALLDRLPHLPPAERVALDPVLLMMLSAAILAEHYHL